MHHVAKFQILQHLMANVAETFLVYFDKFLTTMTQVTVSLVRLTHEISNVGDDVQALLTHARHLVNGPPRLDHVQEVGSAAGRVKVLQQLTGTGDS